MKQLFTGLFCLFVLLSSNAFAQEKNHFKQFFEKGERHRKAKEYKEAIFEYSSALLIADTSATTHFWKGVCHLKLQEYDAAMKDWDKSIAIDPTFKPPYLEKINAYKAKNDNEKVIEIMNSMANADPDVDSKANGKLNIAKLLFDMKRYNRAMQFTKEAMSVKSDYMDAILMHGQVLNKLGKCVEAAQTLEKATAKLGDSNTQASAAFFYELGYAYHQCGKFDKSKEAFTRADFGPYKALIAKLQPDYYYSVASVYSQVYEYETAENMLNNALRIDETYAQANVLMADMEIKQGQYQKGIPFLQKALQNANGDKSYEMIYTRLIDMMLNAKKYAEAITYADKCLGIFPNAKNATFMKAVALNKSEKKEEAIELLNNLMNAPGVTQVDRAQYNFLLGTIYGSSKPEEAKKALTESRKGPFTNASQYLYDLIDEQTGKGI
ncbi:tetratricopeptide repeat protein [Limibacter armeniacum]|uniref:tetratricopeptide repeat protein n=1 Tax=Limibacter armeniacum TaxID=466084 RepID=UPI002FE540F6